MAKTVGYMITFTTYGTWLQGDKRGYVKDGKEFDSNKELLDANRKAMSGQRVKLGTRDKEIVRQAILNEAQQMKQKVRAILVWSSHVHIIAENTNEDVGKVAGRYKAAATKALREMGFKGKVWTKGFDKRFCFNEKDLKIKVDYVNRHGKR
jgi:REP element-mobilizing transposase RayT